MTTATQTDDPFAGSDKAPSISFKDAPIGTTFEGIVTEAPKMVQARDFETGEPANWPDGNPKMTVVLRMSIDGEERSLWAPKPSAMFAALGEAQKVAGQRITEMGTLAVRYTGDKPNANPRLNPQKLYAAKYTPPAPTPAADPWAAETPAAAPAAPAKAKGWDDKPPF